MMELRRFLNWLSEGLRGRLGPSSAARTGAESLDRPWETEFKKSASEEDIYYCFRLILGRNPSKGEWPGHKSLAGNDLRDVVSTYVSSREFKNRKLGVLSDTEHVLVDLGDYKMYVSPSDVEVGAHIYRERKYESHVTEQIRRVLTPGMYFLDIGANIGYFSLLAANLVGRKGRVLCFEPYQYNVKLLHMNATVNGFENVVIYPFAVADKKGLWAFDSAGSNGVISEIEEGITSLMATTLVYSVNLDDVLGGIERLDVIKIDVEGAEYMALSGGHDLLRGFRPTIFSEFSPPALNVVSGVSAEAYLRLLLVDEGYSVAVCDKDSGLVDCKRDMNKVIKCFQDSGVDHIDIVAYPADS
jgi:FkbM family methyltransferase